MSAALRQACRDRGARLRALPQSEHRSLNRTVESSWRAQSLTLLPYEASCFAPAADKAFSSALRAPRPSYRDRGSRHRNARRRVASHPTGAISSAPNGAPARARVRKTNRPRVTSAPCFDSTAAVTPWPMLWEASGCTAAASTPRVLSVNADGGSAASTTTGPTNIASHQETTCA